MKKWSMLALLSCLVLNAAEPEIYFSFDRSARADFGGGADTRQEIAGTGNEQGVIGNLIRGTDKTPDKILTDGIAGKALRIGNSSDGKAKQTWEYKPFTPISAAEGSISFWVRPVDWVPAERNFHHFFGAFSKKERILIYNYLDNQQLIFRFGSLAAGAPSTGLQADISKWEKNTWHHVCAVWDAKTAELYVDGQKSAEAPRKNPPAAPFTRFQLGEYWSGNPGSSSLDELKIYKKRLSAQEVRDEYLRHAGQATAGSAPVQLGVGSGTASVDGVIASGEYAVAVSGMNNSMNAPVQYSHRQSRCFLSWDAENLYAAMESPAENGIKCTHKERDANLWEDDAVELFFSEFDGRKDAWQFIFNSGKGFYDSKNRKADWQSSGIRFASSVKNGVWTFECAIPWKNFGFTPAAGKDFRINFCRDFAENNEWTCLAPGDYFAVPAYAKVTLLPDAPHLDLAQFGALYDGTIQSRITLRGRQDDTVKAGLSVKASIFPFNFEKTFTLANGSGQATEIAGKVPDNGNLEILIKSDKYGVLYKNLITYKTLLPVRLTCIRTDIPNQTLVMEVENARLQCGKNQLRVIMEDVKSSKKVYERTLSIPDDVLKAELKYPIQSLPDGEYILRYTFLAQDGRELFKDYEGYAKYPAVRPWTDCKYGLDNVVPPPWTAPEATDNSFICWGRKFLFGGQGVIASMSSLGRELLAAPVQLKWNGAPVIFHSSIRKRGKGYTDYVLVPADRKIPVEMVVRAEFDGLLWFTVNLRPGGEPLRSLALEIPMKRENITGFDDCFSITEKKDLLRAGNGMFHVNPVERPYFWCGGDDVGLMGGSDTRRGWHLRDKAKGLQVVHQDKTVTLNLNLVDTPLLLKAPRSLEFYLQPTPVKPKNMEMRGIRVRENMICWGEYVTLYFAHKRPGKFSERHLKYFREQQEKHGKRVFYYNAPKGASPVSPEWNYFGMEWHCSPPRLGEYMRDAQTPNRAARNMYLSTFACLNSKDFFDYKLDSIGGFLQNPEYKVRDLYFDLTWPRPCANPVHGCQWTDEFGYRHRDGDLKQLRLLLKRLYIQMKQKDATALFCGHTISTRLPSDVFFDSLLVGELYDRHILNGPSYYNVLTPDLMRIAYASRNIEMEVSLIPQFERALQLFAPDRYAKLNPAEPEMDRAICHFLGYMLVHDLGSRPTTKNNARMKEFYAARDRIAGRSGAYTFHPYWEEKNSPVKPSFFGKYCMVSCFSNPGRLTIAALNDSDKTETFELSVDTARFGLKKDITGMELISNRKVEVKNGKLTSVIGPRGLRIFVFD